MCMKYFSDMVSPWVLRFELDKKQKLHHKLTMDVIESKIKVCLLKFKTFY